MYALLLAMINITHFVNFIIWHDNVEVVAPIWCDIVTKIQLGVPLGIRACTLVLCLQLFNISRMRKFVSTGSRSERRRELALDLFLTLGLPLVDMAACAVLHFCIERERIKLAGL